MSENSLRRLRRAAGYSSAKTFAEVVGIPGPTYARYEQIEDGPETSMPIKNAWAIADQLCCSIDALVGREKPSVEEVKGNVQAAYNALSEAGRAKLLDYLEYLAYADEQERERQRERESLEYAVLERELEAQFEAAGEANPFAYTAPGTRRSRFEAFLLEKAQAAAGRSEQEISAQAAREAGGDASLAAKREADMKAEHSQRNGEVMTKIMEAYDAAHPESKPQGEVEYSFLTLDS